MPDKLNLLDLMSAIASAEGAFNPANLPAKNNNPGDLDWAHQAGAVEAGRFAKFDKWERGVTQGLRQILRRVDDAATLRMLITAEGTGWAPASDGNNSAVYLRDTIARIAKVSGVTIDPDKPLWDYLIIEEIRLP
jgi:hypothetical protein